MYDGCATVQAQTGRSDCLSEGVEQAAEAAIHPEFRGFKDLPRQEALLRVPQGRISWQLNMSV